MVRNFNPISTTKEAEAGKAESEATLVYRVSSKTARETLSWEKQNKQMENKKKSPPQQNLKPTKLINEQKTQMYHTNGANN